MKLQALPFTLGVLFASSHAFAADEALPTPMIEPVVAESVPPSAVLAAPSPTGSVRCILVEESGVPHAEAIAASSRVCAELLQRDPRSSDMYAVHLTQLGSRVIVAVDRVDASRAVVDQRTATLSGLEEILVAGPRLAEALVSGKTLEGTATVTTILNEEAHVPKARGGRLGYDFGVTGTSAFGFAALPSAGAYTALHYETASRVGLKLEARLGGVGGQTKVSGGTLDVGSRYFTSDRDTSPYIGGGVGFGFWENSAPAVSSGPNSYTYTESVQGSGFNAYATAGMQFMRVERVAFDVGVRVDAPMFGLNHSFRGGLPTKYMVPASLNLGLSFR